MSIFDYFEYKTSQSDDLLLFYLGKITNKRSQISSREEELKLIAPRASGKDLSTTEREMNTKMEEKESLTNQISALNKETSTLNSSINQANISATRAENLVREKEKAYQNEQEAQTKKQMLKDSIDLVKEQEEKVSFISEWPSNRMYIASMLPRLTYNKQYIGIA